MPPKRKYIGYDSECDYQPVAPSPSKAKRQKKDLATGSGDTENGEKRLARFKPSCPKNIQERVHRVRTQRFFMIHRERHGAELQETFQVLGSTGNVYTVTIGLQPSCDCPDAAKGNHCKHILFVFLKVLAVPETNHVYYQKALLSSELERVFAEAPVAPNVAANQRILEAYAEATGKKLSTLNDALHSGATGAERRDVDGEDCPVCYETMDGKPESLDSIVFCDTCRNGLHKQCFQQWALKKPVTCVYCRAPWTSTSGSGAAMAGPSKSSEGYTNLGGVAGVSPIRDVSTYYQGPRKGGRKWYY